MSLYRIPGKFATMANIRQPQELNLVPMFTLRNAATPTSFGRRAVKMVERLQWINAILKFAEKTAYRVGHRDPASFWFSSTPSSRWSYVSVAARRRESTSRAPADSILISINDDLIEYVTSAAASSYGLQQYCSSQWVWEVPTEVRKFPSFTEITEMDFFVFPFVYSL